MLRAKKRLFPLAGRPRYPRPQYEHWGLGTVVEEMTSSLAGGTCLVRVLFEDGQQRTFSNDLDSKQCCYCFGLRREHL